MNKIAWRHPEDDPAFVQKYKRNKWIADVCAHRVRSIIQIYDELYPIHTSDDPDSDNEEVLEVYLRCLLYHHNLLRYIMDCV